MGTGERRAAQGSSQSVHSSEEAGNEDLDLQARLAEANYQQALAVRENAKINLDRTTVYAPVNGNVTNLVVDEGDFAEVGKAVLAVVDSDSFRVEAYLEETKLNFVKVGDSATIILMSGAPAIQGRVAAVTLHEIWRLWRKHVFLLLAVRHPPPPN